VCRATANNSGIAIWKGTVSSTNLTVFQRPQRSCQKYWELASVNSVLKLASPSQIMGLASCQLVKAAKMPTTAGIMKNTANSAR
jgi:hypothetical protein